MYRTLRFVGNKSLWKKEHDVLFRLELIKAVLGKYVFSDICTCKMQAHAETYLYKFAKDRREVYVQCI